MHMVKRHQHRLSLLVSLAISVGHIAPLYAESVLQHNPISRFYSNTETQLKLSFAPGWSGCKDSDCLAKKAAFDAQVARLGQTLQSQLRAKPTLANAAAYQFDFKVADKRTLGTLSDASANVIVFRSLQESPCNDMALSFLMAREMANVVLGHHDKNIATKLLISAAATVVFPALVFLSASSAAQQASTATTIVSNAASTATSFFGGEAAVSQAKPTQLRAADDWALQLLGYSASDLADIASLLQLLLEPLNSTQQNQWTEDLQATVQYLQTQSALAMQRESAATAPAPELASETSPSP